jgi:hypothetical protein
MTRFKTSTRDESTVNDVDACLDCITRVNATVIITVS